MKYFEEPYEDYIKCMAEISYVGTKEVDEDVKCFLWLPQKPLGEPHVYFFLDELKDRKLHFNLNKPQKINLRINIKFANGQIYKTHLLKNLSFHGSESIVIADGWNESYIKYSFPKYVITITPVNERSEYKFHFFITESNLLKSIISVREHQTGEISRSVLSKICIEKELAHFGIKLMETEEYIGNNKASIIEITPMTPVNSMLAFFRRVEYNAPKI